LGAICPARGTGAGLALTKCNINAMQLHLAEISRTVEPDAHAVLLMDRAGWHVSEQLNVPQNISIVFLPPRSPELNPVENIWQYMRQNWLSNRIFNDLDHIINVACDAWNKLIRQPDIIKSIGSRDWAHIDKS
jgi:transposase